MIKRIFISILIVLIKNRFLLGYRFAIDIVNKFNISSFLLNRLNQNN